MADFLQRYERGECEKVWAELLAYGSQIREEPLYSEAVAVARETMRRARSNIELLIPRLNVIGYQFGYGWIQPYIYERLTHPYRKYLDGGETKIVQPPVPQRFTYEDRITYMEMLEFAKNQPPPFVPATDAEEHIASLEQRLQDYGHPTSAYATSLREGQKYYRSQPQPIDLIQQIEQLIGTLPLSVRTWYEIVGGVNFVGYHPEWRKLLPEDVAGDEDSYYCSFHFLDPLFIYPLDQERIEYYRHYTVPYHRLFKLSTDGWAKYYGDGINSYWIALPNKAIDALFHEDEITFIHYLRRNFRWGGFPGWENFEKRPEQDLHFLTKDLLPI